MSKSIRKFVAVFLLLWLPLFGTSAVAESLAMQLRSGDCHEQAAMMEMDHHAMMAMADHHMMQHDQDMQMADDSSSTCTACGICHIACSAFLAAPAIVPQVAENGSQAVAYTPAHFVSHLSAPLDPPPLAIA